MEVKRILQIAKQKHRGKNGTRYHVASVRDTDTAGEEAGKVGWGCTLEGLEATTRS